MDRNGKAGDFLCRRNGKSPSSQRAWIEILIIQQENYGYLVALLAEGVDRNYADDEYYMLDKRSPSSQRAWIEIPAAL